MGKLMYDQAGLLASGFVRLCALSGAAFLQLLQLLLEPHAFDGLEFVQLRRVGELLLRAFICLRELADLGVLASGELLERVAGFEQSRVFVA